MDTKMKQVSSTPTAKMQTVGWVGALVALIIALMQYFLFGGEQESLVNALETYLMLFIPVAVAWIAAYFKRPAPKDQIVAE